MNWKKYITAENLSYGFFSLFLLTFTFPLRKVLFEGESYATGLFSEFLTISFEGGEIFLALAFIFFAFTPQKNTANGKNFLMILLFLLLIIQIPILFAKNVILAYGGFLKLIELFFIAFFLFASQYPLRRLAGIFLIVGLFQGAIGIGQFLQGSAVGLSFLGEQPLSTTLTGAPKIIFDNQIFLRATGTFLHPNVLACFLVITFFVAENLKKPWAYLRWILILPLLLTFSRSGFLALMVGFLVNTEKRGKNFLLLGIIIGGAMLIPLLREIAITRLTLGNSFVERVDIFTAAYDMILSHPLGVGAKNFLLNLPPTSTWLYQPVHNIFLLFAAENGIIASLFFLMLFALAFWQNKSSRPLVAALFVCGLLDHFLLTLHAGLVMTALVFGIAFRKEEWLKERTKILLKRFVSR